MAEIKEQQRVEHQWNRDGEKCVRCGAKDWMEASCLPDAANLPKAEPEGGEPSAFPKAGIGCVDDKGCVRTPRLVNEPKNEIMYTCSNEEGLFTATLQQWQIVYPGATPEPGEAHASPAETLEELERQTVLLHSTDDSTVWARAFCAHLKRYPDMASDRATMNGWFANAICAAWDCKSRRDEAKPAPAAVQGVELLPRLSYEDVCLLSRIFNQGYLLGTAQWERINDWLKAEIDRLKGGR